MERNIISSQTPPMEVTYEWCSILEVGVVCYLALALDADALVDAIPAKGPVVCRNQ